ncbi:MAG TPA: 2Fe-2S iron-sulfur cluster-binding protein [Alloacidobacterium sp.]|nr:2Fe-2S iron-sulfur cluster-binding protein [Alloacidobacterium sp.]
MPDQFTVRVNDVAVAVDRNTSIAAAVMIAGSHCRISVSGEPRAPFCGMGICFECRAIVNGNMHSRTCQMLCTPGMEIQSQ